LTAFRHRCGAPAIILGLGCRDRAQFLGANNIISLISLVAYATPGFWLGLMMIVIFFDRPRLAADKADYDTVGAGSRGLGRGFGDVGFAQSRDARPVSLALFLPRALCAPHASVRPGADRHGLRHDQARAKGQTEASHHDGVTSYAMRCCLS